MCAYSKVFGSLLPGLTCILVGSICASPVLAASNAQYSDIPGDQIESLLEDRFEALRSPGAAWAIVSRDGIVYAGTRGYDSGGNPVTTATPFIWGSVSKPVAATAVMTLVERGAVELDHPVRAYLPSFALSDSEAARRITVRHLLEQISGIPESTGLTDRFGTRADPFGDAVVQLAKIDPVSQPGEKHQYSSTNYLVLGAMIEAVTGMSFESYLLEHVLGPLGMRQPIATAEAAAMIPPGYGYKFERQTALDIHYDPLGRATATWEAHLTTWQDSLHSISPAGRQYWMTLR